MKILKFTKLRNGMYKLKLENESEIKVHEELILKKDLLITKDISLDDINVIDKLNNNFNAYDIAVKYISTKVRSCFEVYEYLEKKEIDKVVSMTEKREVTYYRYRIREYVGGNVDYKWSTSKNDKKLLDAGYKLTGRTR